VNSYRGIGGKNSSSKAKIGFKRSGLQVLSI